MQRNPSHLGSYSRPGARGTTSTARASIGRTGGMTGSCTGTLLLVTAGEKFGHPPTWGSYGGRRADAHRYPRPQGRRPRGEAGGAPHAMTRARKRLNRREFLAAGLGTAGAVAAGGTLFGGVLPLLAHEDLVPGRAPELALTPNDWLTEPGR